MPFDRALLSALAYANGCTHRRYGPTADPLAVVRAPDYFAAAALKHGEIVFATAADGAAILIVPAAGPPIPVGVLGPPVRAVLVDEPPPTLASPVTVSGVVSGPAPSGILASVLQGATVVAGPQAGTVDALGSFAVALTVPVGAGYRVRAALADDQAVFDISTETFAVAAGGSPLTHLGQPTTFAGQPITAGP